MQHGNVACNTSTLHAMFTCVMAWPEATSTKPKRKKKKMNACMALSSLHTHVHTYTHTHKHIYIDICVCMYIYVCVCVCVCVCLCITFDQGCQPLSNLKTTSAGVNATLASSADVTVRCRFLKIFLNQVYFWNYLIR